MGLSLCPVRCGGGGSVRWWSAPEGVCDCEADVILMSAVVEFHRPHEGQVRSQKVQHYRRRDQAHFWHWRDTKVVKI